MSVQPDYPQPVADYPRVQAARNANAVAYVDGGCEYTYGELDRRASQVANALAAEGCQPGDRMAYLGVNAGAYVETFFGANKAKVVYVGLNWRLAPAELAYILNDARASLVVADAEHVPMLEALRASVPTLGTIVSAERAAFDAWRNAAADIDPCLEHGAEDTILQFYTSGTTGNPKGVMITNRCMSEHRRAEDQFGSWYLSPEPREVSINAMPNFHIGGLGWLLIGMFRGAKVILMPAPDPAQFLDAIERYRATHLFTVPVVLGMMLEAQKQRPRDISSLRVIHYGASAIAPSFLREALSVMQVKFSQYYGMTEANGVVTCLAPVHHDLEWPQLLTSCGLPVSGTELKICDNNGQELPRGVSGEIWVHSGGLMKGYWNQPQASRDALVDGWYRSGDGGKVDDEGFLYMSDRIKDMVVSGGENIYPSEVEHQLVEHPDIVEAAVVGVPDSKWGEALKAFVVSVEHAEPSPEHLIEFLRERIAGYKIPRQYEFIEELPRTASGKVQKFRLRN